MSSDRDNDSCDHAIETEYFSENKDKNEGYKNLLVNGIEFNTLFSNKSDGIAGCNIAEATNKASTELEHCTCTGFLNQINLLRDEDGDDKTIDRQNTSHNDRDN